MSIAYIGMIAVTIAPYLYGADLEYTDPLQVLATRTKELHTLRTERNGVVEEAVITVEARSGKIFKRIQDKDRGRDEENEVNLKLLADRLSEYYKDENLGPSEVTIGNVKHAVEKHRISTSNEEYLFYIDQSMDSPSYPFDGFGGTAAIWVPRNTLKWTMKHKDGDEASELETFPDGYVVNKIFSQAVYRKWLYGGETRLVEMCSMTIGSSSAFGIISTESRQYLNNYVVISKYEIQNTTDP